MVVGVFIADLHGVVIDIRNGELVLDVLNAHRFELQIRHCAGRILSKRLIDANADLGVGFGIALHEMGGKYFFYYVHKSIILPNHPAAVKVSTFISGIGLFDLFPVEFAHLSEFPFDLRTRTRVAGRYKIT